MGFFFSASLFLGLLAEECGKDCVYVCECVCVCVVNKHDEEDEKAISSDQSQVT